MVRSANNVSGSTFKKTEAKTMLIEEKSSKPPGVSRFSRTKTEEKDMRTPLFKNDTCSVADLCQQMLVNGFVQSYVDFYHLTHRLDPNMAQDRGEVQIRTTMDDMIFIRDQLVKAELSRRQGDTSSVYTAFNKLADFYVASHDWKTSFFFHEKCLEVAQLTNDARGEMAANHSLGSIYQRMLDFDGARAFHEKHEEIAVGMDVFEEIARANAELYKVYLVLAERLEAEGRIEEALGLYFRCLEAAKKSWDRAAESEANGRVGNLLLNRGEAQESLSYLKQQSQIATDLGHAEGRCRACSALALALDQLGQPEKALAELTLVHTISEQAGDAYLQAQACRSLGVLYSKMGQLNSAVDILQRHFSLLKTILYRSTAVGDKGAGGAVKKAGGGKPTLPLVTSKDVDLARSYIGISRGNLQIGAYVLTLQCDLSSLLDWKLNRAELPRPADLASKMEEVLRGGGHFDLLASSSQAEADAVVQGAAAAAAQTQREESDGDSEGDS